MTKQHVRSLVRARPFEPPYYKFGIHAGYTDVDTWGIKLFTSKGARDKNFDLQSRAYLHGLAPNIKDCFTEQSFGGLIVHGFMTEAVPFTEHERFYGHKDVDGFDVIDYNEWRRENLALVQELKYQLEKIGISSKDVFHWDNVGYLRGGLVCIDFSCEDFA